MEQLVKRRVQEYDTKRLKVSSKLYKSLGMITIGTKLTMIGWWQYGRLAPWDINRCRTVIRLLLNTYRLGKVNCQLCNNYKLCDITHILFECESLEQNRNRLWEMYARKHHQI